MSVFKVVLVLGKRLVNNTLTAEGKSRVEELPALISTLIPNQYALVFCGGITEGQSRSEAEAMQSYFKQCYPEWRAIETHTLLEDQSTNTVENIRNAADTLLASDLCCRGQKVEFVFVSNDYHLQRIFEIQRLLDAQGLLRVLKFKCEQSGLRVKISMELSDHCPVPYPHSGCQAEAFIAIDELTTYRVYLEGCIRNAFQLDLHELRRLPLQIATTALERLNNEGYKQNTKQKLARVEQLIHQTVPGLSPDDLKSMTGELDRLLRSLNRDFDPEQMNASL